MASKKKTRIPKPSKPYPDFPLFPHATKRWAKKIRGKMEYFGPWEDPDGALANYLSRKDALYAGIEPAADPNAITVRDAAEAYLDRQKAKLDQGTMALCSFNECKQAADLFVEGLGKRTPLAGLRPDHFAKLRASWPGSWGLWRQLKFCRQTRSILKLARETWPGLPPFSVGTHLKPPTKVSLRKARAARGDRSIPRETVLALLAAADPQRRAWVLLGLNCGFGPHDLATLQSASIDLDTGWLANTRTKTGVARRCPLWPETVEAVKGYLAIRPQAADPAAAGLVFLTRTGRTWVRREGAGEISKSFTKLVDAAGVELPEGVSFYGLRHLHRTLADRAKDQPAADLTMGHANESMASHYREWIDDDRLHAVVGKVREWLWPSQDTSAEPDAFSQAYLAGFSAALRLIGIR